MATARVGYKLTEGAITPTKAHETDSGYDLYVLEDTIIEAGKTVIVKTGVSFQLPDGYDATVRPRSGISSKTDLLVILGTVDNAYTGGIGIILRNLSTPVSDYEVETRKTLLDLLYNSNIMLGTPETQRSILSKLKHDGKVNYVKLVTGEKVQTIERYPEGTYLLKKGDKLAQLCIHDNPKTVLEPIEGELVGERGSNGFGSTGV